MFISPRKALNEGWIIPPISISDEVLESNHIQPNAIDFTIDRLFASKGPFIIGEEEKVMRESYEWKAKEHLEGNPKKYFPILPEDCFDAMSDFYVNIPQGVMALLFVRSTFNRNGIFLTSGIYDSGFKGHISYSIHNRSKEIAFVAPGTRIGQIAFITSDSVKDYGGTYNTVIGQHWSQTDKK